MQAARLHKASRQALGNKFSGKREALLDAYTILEHKKSLRGLKVVLVGDILHSRVARSNIHLLAKFGAKVALCGPPDLLPELATTLVPGLRLERDFDRAVAKADVI